jgi:hypothetical protein
MGIDVDKVARFSHTVDVADCSRIEPQMPGNSRLIFVPL